MQKYISYFIKITKLFQLIVPYLLFKNCYHSHHFISYSSLLHLKHIYYINIISNLMYVHLLLKKKEEEEERNEKKRKSRFPPSPTIIKIVHLSRSSTRKHRFRWSRPASGRKRGNRARRRGSSDRRARNKSATESKVRPGCPAVELR